MDSVKIKKILSAIAVVVLIIIVVYNSGIFGGNSDNGGNDISAQQDQTSVTGLTDAENAGENNGVIAADTVSDNTDSASDTNNADLTPATENTDTTSPTDNSDPSSNAISDTQYTEYRFRTNKLLTQHYEKHGIEMGFDSKESYEKAASDVINDPSALHKTEAEDGDYVYYIEETNEFVILSQDGYIRTYFLPSAGKAYYDRQ